ncbi:LysR family transcriptional regulator [Streptomyces antarcticus]|uniref:LysR substrate-binding domain-containing protein n=1 Tax=Streptomyces antarcticus TaxID=2996458 RepID=UPI0022715ED2|nr:MULTISPECIES: LysR family transcriptional regulator [unclassified Streptomyces]MCY0940715.1 LysR family transcriptional regulator [Streptomyces sp. H34-AA3]MCY0948595.1 LysR family transcriptional regulator [Streptomyces sp. H27-S2]MCZ4082018.1 LysR family transcriptional regulator [Streptomyces sp. H34-S5]
MDLELRHLKIVRAVADAGSLTRAATALGIAQPALSTQLKRIERVLGGALFVRGREGVRATPLGELVLDRARVVLPAVCELQEEAVRFARQGADGYRLGGTHGPLLGGLVDRLAREEPGVPVTTYTSWSEKDVAGSVADGRLDFALVGVCGESAPPEPGRLAWMEVARDAVYVMLAEDHPLAARREIDLAELAAEAWTDVPGDGCFGDCFAAACVRAGFTPACVYETDTASCVHLVQVGRAVGLCRATFPVTPGVVARPLAGTPLVWRHLLGWHPAARSAGRAADVLEHARAAHAQALAGSAGAADGVGGPVAAGPGDGLAAAAATPAARPAR